MSPNDRCAVAWKCPPRGGSPLIGNITSSFLAGTPVAAVEFEPRTVPKLGLMSRRLAIVVVEETAQSFATCHVTAHDRSVPCFQDELVAESLVIAFSVVVLCQNPALCHAARR